jgi:serine phosphatase RsbU (regulator of sigma subunit)
MASSYLSATTPPWYKRRTKGWQYLSNLPHRRLFTLYLAIFFLFSTFGFYGDLTYCGGHAPVWAVLVVAVFNGAYADLYPYVLIHKPKAWLWLVAFGSCLLGPIFATWLTYVGVSHPGHFVTHNGGIVFAAQGILVGVVGSYVSLISFIRDQASSALRIQNELDLAHSIQRTLVPPLDVAIGGYELHGVSIPSDKVGGDLVDTVEVSTGTVAYVADVAGHGLQAGILMGMIKTAARTILLEDFADPANLLQVFCERLNRVLPGVKEAHMYATLAVLHLGHNGDVHYALAGHPAILQFNAARRSVSQLCCEQFPVGLLPVGAFLTKQTTLSAGDMLIVSTDGILEACNTNDQEFGADRLGALAEKYAESASLATLSQNITRSVRDFGRQADDQTLLLIRRQAIRPVSPATLPESQMALA